DIPACPKRFSSRPSCTNQWHRNRPHKLARAPGNSLRPKSNTRIGISPGTRSDSAYRNSLAFSSGDRNKCHFCSIMSVRAIIADDEPLARERVRSLLASESDVEIITECSNGAQTLKATQEHRPDLLFLDVQMPRLNGFEVIEALEPTQIPVVIFTTAHDDHAIRAFEVNALDYLLKPFTEARFKSALQRARDHLQKSGQRERSSQLVRLVSHVHAATPGGGRILVRSPERIVFLKPDEIDHVEAAGNYVVLHAGKGRHILREATGAMGTPRTPGGFMRVSRSFIVELAPIRRVQPGGARQYVVLSQNGD